LKHITLLLLVIFLQIQAMGQTVTVKSISEDIKFNLDKHLKGKNGNIVKNIYNNMAFSPIWIGAKNRFKARTLITALNDPMFNYKNKSFDQTSIKHLFYLIDNEQISSDALISIYARLDLIMTNSLVRLARFIIEGDVDWKLVQKKLRALKTDYDVSSKWEMSTKSFNDTSGLIAAIKNNKIKTYLLSLIPMKKRYTSLVHILKNYRVMDNFNKLPISDDILKEGDSSYKIIGIKKRLRASGDYPQKASIDKYFDKTLKNSILSYQKRYLLKMTGVIDRQFLAYLNEPVSKNIRAIIVNLDKTKLYPKKFEDEYIEVNLPDFNLRYYHNQQMIKKLGLVVGRIDRPTPVFSSTLRYMVLNPTWTVPNNLIKRDLIHVFRENPLYLEENNIHVFQGNKEIKITSEMLDPYEKNKKYVPYRFVQFPGKTNALGRVKFIFPNKYSVYLHDTDNKSLLERRYKIYSSGCMRVEKPFSLVSILLNYTNKKYSNEEIHNILETNRPTTISFNKAIPVHILYFTVYEENGLAYFKNDIYLYDSIIRESTGKHKKDTFTLPKKRQKFLSRKD